MARQTETLDALRDAAAKGRLMVITGAGISVGLVRPDSTPVPSWSRLIEELRKHVNSASLSAADRKTLDHLLPHGILDKLHGDALIEASGIIQKSMGKSNFLRLVANLCREKPGQCTPTHKAIVRARPVGIVTFNYDLAHEEAFRQENTKFRRLLYSDEEKIRRIILDTDQPPFLMKGHGSADTPRSLILSSESYRGVLANNRAYRTFLQYSFINYTVLIVGFSLRDRDFDQVLHTLDVEWGRTHHRHAFVAKRPRNSASGRALRAHLAAITSRFGVHPLYVTDFAQIPDLIESFAVEPGPYVERLLRDAISVSASVRANAHGLIEQLGPVGRMQVRQGILRHLSRSTSRRARSEFIYALRAIADDVPEVAQKLIEEIRVGVNDFMARSNLWSLECVAHALLVLRRSRLTSHNERRLVLAVLRDTLVLDQFRAMDSWLEKLQETPRILAYAQAAYAEIEARGNA